MDYRNLIWLFVIFVLISGLAFPVVKVGREDATTLDLYDSSFFMPLNSSVYGNFDFSGNLSAFWFKGKFNWTTADDWCSFDGQVLDFNESKLETRYFSVSAMEVVAGTVDGGSINDTKHEDGNFDDVTLNISETAGSPGLDIRFNFTGISEFNAGVMRYKTGSLAGAYPIIQLWSYADNAWHDMPPIAESDERFSTISEPVYDWSEHVSGGVVQMRLYKSSNGNTNNHYYIDWIAISQGIATPAGEEVDPLSVHRDGDVELTGNWDAGNYNITAQAFISDLFVNSTGDLEWIRPENVFDIDKEDVEGDLNTFVDVGGDSMSGKLGVQDVVPISNLTYDIGNATNWFDKAYINELVLGTELTDSQVSNTLTASDLVAASSVVSDSEVDDDITISSSNNVSSSSGFKAGDNVPIWFGNDDDVKLFWNGTHLVLESK